MKPDRTRISMYQSTSDVQVRIYSGFTVALYAKFLSQKKKKKTLRMPHVKHAVTKKP